MPKHHRVPRVGSVAFATLFAAAIAFTTAGCPSLSDATQSLFVRGEPFIVSGTSAVIQRNGGPCKVWYAENGASYHLFQGDRVLNAEFDRATTPGVRSRLEIAPRSDLFLACESGTLVEVQQVLEIVD